jgi:alpha-amylase
MGTVTLLLGIHNHQPQGNFDHVFAQGYEDCYRRLLDAVEGHPRIKMTLHYSGPLIEWLETHHPDYFDTLARLAASGQVEVMGGGFYEPMLSVLPEQDIQGQLTMMADFIEERVGKRPLGMWLAERVWEPDLARVIEAAGYQYTVVDDNHFLAAGMQRPLTGYYITDKAGQPLCLFPISMELRYTIPFKPARESIDQMLRMAEQGDVVVTYGDDGEKFGMWPETKQWVWDEGWMEKFLHLLEQHGDRIHTATFSEVLESHAPCGRVYLPTASYHEMGEWALPPEAQQRFIALSHALEDQQQTEDWGPFVRGATWQSFLAKYPESNFMHKRMCYVSQRVERGGGATDNAVRELYRGQCNCAYWHGLFGGLYLAKLRSAVHSHLIRAHVLASRSGQSVELEQRDITGDLSDELILSGQSLGIMVAPHRGGTLLAIDDRQRAFCISDVLNRRPEGYHTKVRELSESKPKDQQGEGPTSIHELDVLKEEGLADILVYDPHQRLGLVDQFFLADLDPADLWRCKARELGDFKEATYDVLEAVGGEKGRIRLDRRGLVRCREHQVDVTLEKSLVLDGDMLDVGFAITADRPLEGVCFATELSFLLPCAPHPDVKTTIVAANDSREEHVASTGFTEQVRRLSLNDPLTPMSITLDVEPLATLVRFPLQTVSQSESGIERTYQGTTVVIIWPCSEGVIKPTIRLHLT